MGKRLFLIINYLFSLFCTFNIFALQKENVLSPLPGIWYNKQALVINNLNDEEIYYSLDENDPLSFGFIYDEPALIDKVGPVKLHIAAVDKNGVRTDVIIDYTANFPQGKNLSPEEKSFVELINYKPIYSYTSGMNLQIPENFKFFPNNCKTPVKNNTINLSLDNKLERYVPCKISVEKTGSDSVNDYFFVLNIKGWNSDFSLGQDYPFIIDDWETIVFKDRNYLYQVDSSLWQGAGKSVKVDRSVEHVVRWQPLVNNGNKNVKEFKLLCRPDMVVSKTSLNSIQIFPSLSEYRISGGKCSNLSGISKGQWKKIQLEILDGEELYHTHNFELYCNGLYQGNQDVDFFIDTLPPNKPEIVSSSKQNVTGDKVYITISSNSDETIYYSVSKPVLTESGFNNSTLTGTLTLPSQKFKEYKPGTNIVLKSVDQQAAFYTVYAFCKDKAGNTSAMSNYNVLVDEYNFYLSGESGDNEQDGSFFNPWTDFRQAVDSLNRTNNGRLHVTGMIKVPDGIYEIKKDAMIFGNDCHFVFDKNAVLKFTDSNVEFHDVILEKNNSDNFIIALSSKLTFRDCELTGTSQNYLNLIDCRKSEFNFVSSGITCNSENYSVCVNGSNSKINCLNSRFVSNSITSGIFCLTNSNLNIRGGELYSLGSSKRILELVKSRGQLFNVKVNCNSSWDDSIFKDIYSTYNEENVTYRGN